MTRRNTLVRLALGVPLVVVVLIAFRATLGPDAESSSVRSDPSQPIVQRNGGHQPPDAAREPVRAPASEEAHPVAVEDRLEFVRCIVRSAEGTDLEGAEVIVFPFGQPRWSAGLTDATGVLGIERERLVAHPEVKLVALRSGYSPDSRLLRENEDELSFTLQVADSISGALTFEGATLVLEGLRVVAEDPSAPRFDGTRLLDTEDPELASLSAVTDDAGRFTIPGARADRAYFLYAGGDGFYSRERVAVGFDQDRSSVVVPLEKLFGAVLRYVDEYGADAQVPASFHEGRWWRSVVPLAQSEASSLNQSTPFLGLSGLDPVLITDTPSTWGLQLLSSKVATPLLELITDSGRPPGFEEYQVTYELLPLETGLADVPITLRKRTEGWGRLRIRFVDASTGEEFGPDFAPLPGFVHLYAGEPEQLAEMVRPTQWPSMDSDHVGGLDLEVYADGGSIRDLEGIPYGTYAARYQDFHGAYAYPEKGSPGVLIEVTANEVPELVLPLAGPGAIEIELLHADGTPYEGNVMTKVGRYVPAKQPGSPARVVSRTIYSAPSPAILRGLEEGTWSIQILVPGVTAKSGSWEFDAEVEAGRTTSFSRVVR